MCMAAAEGYLPGQEKADIRSGGVSALCDGMGALKKGLS